MATDVHGSSDDDLELVGFRPLQSNSSREQSPAASGTAIESKSTVSQEKGVRGSLNSGNVNMNFTDRSSGGKGISPVKDIPQFEDISSDEDIFEENSFSLEKGASTNENKVLFIGDSNNQSPALVDESKKHGVDTNQTDSKENHLENKMGDPADVDAEVPKDNEESVPVASSSPMVSGSKTVSAVSEQVPAVKLANSGVELECESISESEPEGDAVPSKVDFEVFKVPEEIAPTTHKETVSLFHELEDRDEPSGINVLLVGDKCKKSHETSGVEGSLKNVVVVGDSDTSESRNTSMNNSRRTSSESIVDQSSVTLNSDGQLYVVKVNKSGQVMVGSEDDAGSTSTSSNRKGGRSKKGQRRKEQKQMTDDVKNKVKEKTLKKNQEGNEEKIDEQHNNFSFVSRSSRQGEKISDKEETEIQSSDYLSSSKNKCNEEVEGEKSTGKDDGVVIQQIEEENSLKLSTMEDSSGADLPKLNVRQPNFFEKMGAKSIAADAVSKKRKCFKVPAVEPVQGSSKVNDVESKCPDSLSGLDLEKVKLCFVKLVDCRDKIEQLKKQVGSEAKLSDGPVFEASGSKKTESEDLLNSNVELEKQDTVKEKSNVCMTRSLNSAGRKSINKEEFSHHTSSQSKSKEFSPTRKGQEVQNLTVEPAVIHGRHRKRGQDSDLSENQQEEQTELHPTRKGQEAQNLTEEPAVIHERCHKRGQEKQTDLSKSGSVEPKELLVESEELEPKNSSEESLTKRRGRSSMGLLQTKRESAVFNRNKRKGRRQKDCTLTDIEKPSALTSEHGHSPCKDIPFRFDDQTFSSIKDPGSPVKDSVVKLFDCGDTVDEMTKTSEVQNDSLSGPPNVKHSSRTKRQILSAKGDQSSTLSNKNESDQAACPIDDSTDEFEYGETNEYKTGSDSKVVVLNYKFKEKNSGVIKGSIIKIVDGDEARKSSLARSDEQSVEVASCKRGQGQPKRKVSKRERDANGVTAVSPKGGKYVQSVSESARAEESPQVSVNISSIREESPVKESVVKLTDCRNELDQIAKSLKVHTDVALTGGGKSPDRKKESTGASPNSSKDTRIDNDVPESEFGKSASRGRGRGRNKRAGVPDSIERSGEDKSEYVEYQVKDRFSSIPETTKSTSRVMRMYERKGSVVKDGHPEEDLSVLVKDGHEKGPGVTGSGFGDRGKQKRASVLESLSESVNKTKDNSVSNEDSVKSLSKGKVKFRKARMVEDVKEPPAPIVDNTGQEGYLKDDTSDSNKSRKLGISSNDAVTLRDSEEINLESSVEKTGSCSKSRGRGRCKKIRPKKSSVEASLGFESAAKYVEEQIVEKSSLVKSSIESPGVKKGTGKEGSKNASPVSGPDSDSTIESPVSVTEAVKKKRKTRDRNLLAGNMFTESDKKMNSAKKSGITAQRTSIGNRVSHNETVAALTAKSPIKLKETVVKVIDCKDEINRLKHDGKIEGTKASCSDGNKSFTCSENKAATSTKYTASTGIESMTEGSKLKCEDKVHKNTNYKKNLGELDGEINFGIRSGKKVPLGATVEENCSRNLLLDLNFVKSSPVKVIGENLIKDSIVRLVDCRDKIEELKRKIRTKKFDSKVLQVSRMSSSGKAPQKRLKPSRKGHGKRSRSYSVDNILDKSGIVPERKRRKVMKSVDMNEGDISGCNHEEEEESKPEDNRDGGHETEDPEIPELVIETSRVEKCIGSDGKESDETDEVGVVLPSDTCKIGNEGNEEEHRHEDTPENVAEDDEDVVEDGGNVQNKTVEWELPSKEKEKLVRDVEDDRSEDIPELETEGARNDSGTSSEDSVSPPSLTKEALYRSKVRKHSSIDVRHADNSVSGKLRISRQNSLTDPSTVDSTTKKGKEAVRRSRKRKDSQLELVMENKRSKHVDENDMKEDQVFLLEQRTVENLDQSNVKVAGINCQSEVSSKSKRGGKSAIGGGVTHRQSPRFGDAGGVVTGHTVQCVGTNQTLNTLQGVDGWESPVLCHHPVDHCKRHLIVLLEDIQTSAGLQSNLHHRRDRSRMSQNGCRNVHVGMKKLSVDTSKIVVHAEIHDPPSPSQEKMTTVNDTLPSLSNQSSLSDLNLSVLCNTTETAEESTCSDFGAWTSDSDYVPKFNDKGSLLVEKCNKSRTRRDSYLEGSDDSAELPTFNFSSTPIIGVQKASHKIDRACNKKDAPVMILDMSKLHEESVRNRDRPGSLVGFTKLANRETIKHGRKGHKNRRKLSHKKVVEDCNNEVDGTLVEGGRTSITCEVGDGEAPGFCLVEDSDSDVGSDHNLIDLINSTIDSLETEEDAPENTTLTADSLQTLWPALMTNGDVDRQRHLSGNSEVSCVISPKKQKFVKVPRGKFRSRGQGKTGRSVDRVSNGNTTGRRVTRQRNKD